MIKENITNLKKKIKNAANEFNRNYNDITLIAVSKSNPVSAIKQVKNLGIIDFGENKVQELKQKYIELNDEVRWHFIGHLQTNKVKDVVKMTYLIHSIDSVKLAQEIDKRANEYKKLQNILIEVKTSEEENKFGIKNFNDVLSLANYCKNCENLNLLGLMTMAPFTNDEIVISNSFIKLRNMFTELNKMDFNLKHLSMGMTNDFRIAIKEGSTMLRIGTAIFSGN